MTNQDQVKQCRKIRNVPSCKTCVRYGDRSVKGCPYKMGEESSEPMPTITICVRHKDIDEAKRNTKNNLLTNISLPTNLKALKQIRCYNLPVPCYLVKEGARDALTTCLLIGYDGYTAVVTDAKNTKKPIHLAYTPKCLGEVRIS